LFSSLVFMCFNWSSLIPMSSLKWSKMVNRKSSIFFKVKRKSFNFSCFFWRWRILCLRARRLKRCCSLVEFQFFFKVKRKSFNFSCFFWRWRILCLRLCSPVVYKIFISSAIEKVLLLGIYVFQLVITDSDVFVEVSCWSDLKWSIGRVSIFLVFFLWSRGRVSIFIVLFFGVEEFYCDFKFGQVESIDCGWRIWKLIGN
jgi:hypothetical protein